MGYFKEFFIDGKKVKSLYLNGKKVKLQATQVLGPLCFTAESSSCTIRITGGTTAPTLNLKYSTDGETWQDYTVGSTEINLTSIGDKVYFKADGTNQCTGSSASAYNKFNISGNIAASGNLNSLLTDDLEEAMTLSLAGKNYCYGNLFNGCRTLTSAPELPSTTLGQDCYNSLFRDCAYLTSAPELPAVNLEVGCYSKMFYGTGIVESPELPATTLVNYCYENMFAYCGNLIVPPQLPATTMAQFGYYNMFLNCSKLKVNEVAGTKFLDLPSGTPTPVQWSTGMFSGTGGTVTGSPNVGQPYYYDDTPTWGTGSYTVSTTGFSSKMTWNSDFLEYASSNAHLSDSMFGVYINGRQYENDPYSVDRTKRVQDVVLTNIDDLSDTITVRLVWRTV